MNCRNSLKQQTFQAGKLNHSLFFAKERKRHPPMPVRWLDKIAQIRARRASRSMEPTVPMHSQQQGSCQKSACQLPPYAPFRRAKQENPHKLYMCRMYKLFKRILPSSTPLTKRPQREGNPGQAASKRHQRSSAPRGPLATETNPYDPPSGAASPRTPQGSPDLSSGARQFSPIHGQAPT